MHRIIFAFLVAVIVSLIGYFYLCRNTVKTIKPSRQRTWQKINYNYGGLNGTDAPAGESEAMNQKYVLSKGYDCYVYDDNNTIYPRKQGIAGQGNTLLVYKDGLYWIASDTDVEFGPNDKSAFASATLGAVLSSIKNTSFNMVLLRGIVSPTSPAMTTVSGTYASDAAMLNVNSDTSFFTWFYGGTSFPYSYTLTNFTPTIAT